MGKLTSYVARKRNIESQQMLKKLLKAGHQEFKNQNHKCVQPDSSQNGHYPKGRQKKC